MDYARQLSIDLRVTLLYIDIRPSHPSPHLVVIIVVEKLAECEQVCKSQEEAKYLEPGLSAELVVLERRTHSAAVQLNNPLF